MYASRAALPTRLAARRPAAVAAGARRGYAVPVNKRSSVDPVLGIAPPAPPHPQHDRMKSVPSSPPGKAQGSTKREAVDASGESEGSSEQSEGAAFLEWLQASTRRDNNPNDLSDLLRGKRPGKSGSSRSSGDSPQQQQGNANRAESASAVIGAMRRGPGSAIPTQDMENPMEQDPAAASTSKQQVEIEVNAEPPAPVDREHPHPVDALHGRNDLDERILAAARAMYHARQQQVSPGKDASTLAALMDSFDAHSDRTLSVVLPNESSPKDERRVPMTSSLSGEQELQDKQEDGVLLIAYVTGLEGGRGHERITLCSGFAVEGGDRLAEGEGSGRGALVVSCAHTLRGSRPSTAKASDQAGGGAAKEDTSIALAVTRSGHVIPIKALLSSLPMSDLVLLQLGEEGITVDKDTVLGTPLRSSPVSVRTLPVNPYPAAVGTELCVSSFWGWEDDAGSTVPAFEFVDGGASASSSSGRGEGGSTSHQLSTSRSPALTISPSTIPPPIGREQDQVKRERDDAGRSRWGRARLVEYRDWHGQEAVTGSYDELAQLDFKLLPDNMHNPPALQSRERGPAQFPPPGSSGGPIVDAATGAVVGVTRGTKMSQLQGKRGDGVPAERVFFMFALPGFGTGSKPK